MCNITLSKEMHVNIKHIIIRKFKKIGKKQYTETFRLTTSDVLDIISLKHVI